MHPHLQHADGSQSTIPHESPMGDWNPRTPRKPWDDVVRRRANCLVGSVGGAFFVARRADTSGGGKGEHVEAGEPSHRRASSLDVTDPLALACSGLSFRCSAVLGSELSLSLLMRRCVNLTARAMKRSAFHRHSLFFTVVGFLPSSLLFTISGWLRSSLTASTGSESHSHSDSSAS